MKRRAIYWPATAWIITAATIAYPLLAIASGGGDGHGEDHGMSTPVKLTVMTINLLIFLAMLRKTAWPSIVEWVAARRSEVVDALEKAATAKREAEDLKQQWKDRLASLDQEIEEMRGQAEKQIAGEREQILDSARKLADNIRRDAQRAADQEIRNAQEKLRAEVAERAYQLASESASSIGGSDQRRFVDEFIEQVAK